MLRKGIGPMNLGGIKGCSKCQGSVCDCGDSPAKIVPAVAAAVAGKVVDKVLG